MKSYWFFAHVAFGLDRRAHASPQATANLLVEINEKTLTSCAKKKHLKVAGLADPQRAELAAEIAIAAAADYLKSAYEFGQFPAQRFVNFDLIQPQSYISIRPPPAKALANGAKVWRVEESEADKLRGEALSVRYPDIERRLAAHPFLKGMSRHHLELLALCAIPTEFEAGQIIFLEGDPANGFYLIEAGKVVLEGNTSSGEPVVIDTVMAGEPLGWSWLFSPYLWHFDARALEPCMAICLPSIMLRQHRDDDVTLSHELFKRVSEVAVRRLQAVRARLVSRK
jgi:CRP-like cAMP-binding protein